MKILILCLGAVILPAPAAAQGDPVAAMVPIVRRELRAHPGARPADLYKLVYQASMGPAHFGLDSAMATTWLAREWDSLGPDTMPRGALLDTIAPGGRLVRLDLRAYRSRGGSEVALVRAFVASARTVRPDTALLVRRWRALEADARAGRLPWSADTLHRLLQQARRDGFRSPEHSDAYRERYRPAYRVLSGAQADSLLLGLGG